MNNKQKLELTWIGKGENPKLEPRILIEDPAKSYGDKNAENMLIYGDNLLALKALEQDFAGKIKCIYIDPPYNTGNAFDHYDDSLEHSIWLNLIDQRLKILRTLLAAEGSIWITLDDTEVYHCKVMCDEIFGRNNFVGSVIWEKSDSPRMDATYFSVRHDFILVYAKNIESLSLNKQLDEEVPEHYNKTDNNGRIYYLKPLRVMGGNISDTLYFPMIAPDGSKVLPLEPDGRKGCWRWSKKKVKEESERIEWVEGRNGWVPYFRIYADSRKAKPLETIWTHSEVGSNRTSKNEIRALFANDIFGTPKPERLIEKVVAAASMQDDWVLDSFLGSGTTSAVAHKMNRKWIGIELGEHCHTHCIPRLQKVCNGTDQGGISKAQNWKGGGGFKYYYLAPSLLLQDHKGNWIINKHYNPAMLAAAMAKHEGFRFIPDETYYWKQGKSTEKDFIFTTTNFVSVEFIDTIHGEMKSDESLLICCTSFSKAADKYPNITIKKIPKMLLGRCEFGKEDYSLNIVNLPRENDEPAFVPIGPIASNKPKDKKKRDDATDDLFTGANGGKK